MVVEALRREELTKTNAGAGVQVLSKETLAVNPQEVEIHDDTIGSLYFKSGITRVTRLEVRQTEEGPQIHHVIHFSDGSTATFGAPQGVLAIKRNGKSNP